MKPILEIKEISKKFQIQGSQQPYLSLRENLFSFLKPSSKKEEFWALQNVSFDVMPGDTVGIVGKNGAGKSTLLKILSKITPPTSGTIVGRGRIASLLEVGTGFHPELSGRENIFMNGSILGMRRTEINKNFDAIVDFAGVDQFIDTPLKHYSSGMQLRLAFAVAAFLENEILIIDEVLAVGDSEFQKKCIGKMGEVSKSGRTILFVSHQLGVITQLCRDVIVLEKGKLVLKADVKTGTDYYLNNLAKVTNAIWQAEQKTQHKELYFSEIMVCDAKHVPKQNFSFEESIHIAIKIGYNTAISNSKISVTLVDKYQNYVFTVVENLDNYFSVQDGVLKLQLTLPPELIAANNYSFRYAIFNKSGKTYDLVENETAVKIIDTGSSMAEYEGIDYGNFVIKEKWSKGS